MVDDDDFWAVPDELLKPRAEMVSGGLAGAIAKSMAKWVRKPADLYPTPPDCVYSLFPHIEDILPVGSTILEPACADGQLSRALQACGYETLDFDLRPDCGYGTGGVDFLECDAEETYGDEFDAIVTNPPFSAALEFIKRGLELSPVVILLLKSNYYNTKNRLKPWADHTPEWEFKLSWRPAFLEKERGKSPLMDCNWYVFTRDWDEDHSKFRPIERLLDPPNDDYYGGL